MIAAPGGGKGTQGERLAAKFGVQHISSGEVLRAAAGAGTPAGREVAAHQRRGDLVPDEIVFELLTPVVAAAAVRGGYILDGFPRTVPQALEAADVARRLDLTLDAAVYLNVPEPVLMERLVAPGPRRRHGRGDHAPASGVRRVERPAHRLLPGPGHPGGGRRRPAPRLHHRRHSGPAALRPLTTVCGNIRTAFPWSAGP
jgi:adenylate kinase